ncbi:MAG TPA: GNAT family N-acetyltransferase [Chthonomonadaceae bacterium]|nr:GNAT family N-acetyltransferase [Chthonomonadaceae bacterium]
MSSPLQTSLDRQTPYVVRKLAATDSAAFARLCRKHPMRMLTPRLNIEYYGMDVPIMRSWGVFGRDGAEIVGILQRFRNTVIASDVDGECGPALASVIDTLPGVAGMRGPVETVSSVQAALRVYRPTDWEESCFLRLTHPPTCPPATLSLARRAVPSDLDKLAWLYGQAGTMYRSRDNVAAKLAEPRVFVVEEPATALRPARIVSCALLNVEGRDAGLIGGVFTLPEARGRGYAAACTAAISLDLQRDGKLPCLFYENPVAGRVYRRLGFEDAGRWALLFLSAPGARA